MTTPLNEQASASVLAKFRAALNALLAQHYKELGLISPEVHVRTAPGDPKRLIITVDDGLHA